MKAGESEIQVHLQLSNKSETSLGFSQKREGGRQGGREVGRKERMVGRKKGEREEGRERGKKKE